MKAVTSDLNTFVYVIRSQGIASPLVISDVGAVLYSREESI